MSDSGSETLSNLLREERRFPPPPALAAAANATRADYERADADSQGFWAAAAARLDWARPWEQVLDWSGAPFARWFTGGRLNAAYNCLDRHVAAGLGDRVAFHWEGEPGDTRTLTYAELTQEVCRAANALQSLGVARRRPGGHLHADDPGDGGGDAGLRPHRRPAHRGLRRLLRGGAARPDPGLRRPCGDHGGRRLSPRHPLRAETGGGRGRARVSRRPQCPGGPAHRAGGRVDRRPGRVVARPGRGAARRARGGGVRQRASPVHHVHLRYDRSSEGHPAHHGRLSHPGGVDALGGVRRQAGAGRVLDGGGHRLGDRPLVHRLRATRQRRHLGPVRGDAGHPAQGPLVGARREVPGDDPLLRPDRDPHLHEVGRRHPGRLRPHLAAAAGLGRRTHQPRGVDLVPHEHRRERLPRGRHLVADGDRRPDDQPAARA